MSATTRFCARLLAPLSAQRGAPARPNDILDLPVHGGTFTPAARSSERR